MAVKGRVAVVEIDGLKPLGVDKRHPPYEKPLTTKRVENPTKPYLRTAVPVNIRSRLKQADGNHLQKILPLYGKDYSVQC